MWLLRVLAVILLIGFGVSLLAYVATGQRRYRDFAWRLLRYGLLFALAVFALLIFERILVLPF